MSSWLERWAPSHRERTVFLPGLLSSGRLQRHGTSSPELFHGWSVVGMDPPVGQLFQCKRGNFKVYLRELGPQFPCVWWHKTTKHLIPLFTCVQTSLVLECWSLCSDCISGLSTLIADFPSLVTSPKALQASLPLSNYWQTPQLHREEVGTRSWVCFSKYPLSISSSWPGLRYSCRKLNSIWKLCAVVNTPVTLWLCLSETFELISASTGCPRQEQHCFMAYLT